MINFYFLDPLGGFIRNGGCQGDRHSGQDEHNDKGLAHLISFPTTQTVLWKWKGFLYILQKGHTLQTQIPVFPESDAAGAEISHPYFFVSSKVTLTSFVVSPRVSCHTFNWCEPAGTSASLKDSVPPPRYSRDALPRRSTLVNKYRGLTPLMPVRDT